MFPAKFQHILFAIVMAILMSCVMSFVITVFNVGFPSDILTRWLHAWSFGFVVALPTVMLIAPVARRLVALMIRA